MAEASEVRLARPGEGAAVAELVARTHRFATAIDSPLQAAVDAHGGLLRLDVADVPDGRGWCFGAYDRTDLVGVLYACTPVTFIQSFPFEHRDELVRSVIEIEILAVDEHRRQRGIATTLLRHAEDQFAELGVRYIVAKVDATATSTLRWYRHRNYMLTRDGEDLAIETSHGTAGLHAGEPTRWRLAVKAPHTTIVRRGAGLRSHLALAHEDS